MTTLYVIVKGDGDLIGAFSTKEAADVELDEICAYLAENDPDWSRQDMESNCYEPDYTWEIKSVRLVE